MDVGQCKYLRDRSLKRPEIEMWKSHHLRGKGVC